MKNLQAVLESFIKKHSKKVIFIYLITVALQALLFKVMHWAKIGTDSHAYNQLIADYLLFGSLKAFFLSSILFILFEAIDLGKTLFNLSYSISIFLFANIVSFFVDLVQLYTTGFLQPDCQLLVFGFKFLFNPNSSHVFTFQWSDVFFFLSSLLLINASFSNSRVGVLHFIFGAASAAFLAKISFHIIAILEKEIVN